jgi:UDP-N-acetylmuramoyl-L-alanyl-D-glutamate--2,6-diaminopimelate ligase
LALDPSAIEARFAAAHARLVTVATTGTNGKTTTTSMVASIVAASGEPSARLTTIGGFVGEDRIGAAASSVDEFLRTVEAAALAGVRTLALEVTSKALAAGTAKQWPARIGVFTNLTRDHLDMHGTPEAYLAAKAQLFMHLPRGGVAVLNHDDPATELIREVVPPGVRVETFSTKSRTASLTAHAVEVAPGATRVVLAPSRAARELGDALELSVTGAVHAQNAMAAALAARAAGYSPDAIARGLRAFTGVPGRFQLVGTLPLVVVDYAHTPDGLVGTLATARELAKAGRVICVFGCGGERDRGKRPQMGAIADTAADVVVLTNDNPRREPPEAIAAEVRAGVPAARATWIEELDRARAIAIAISHATPTDVVVIAGKGHEDVQEIGGELLPFSDADIARVAIAARGR